MRWLGAHSLTDNLTKKLPLGLIQPLFLICQNELRLLCGILESVQKDFLCIKSFSVHSYLHLSSLIPFPCIYASIRPCGSLRSHQWKTSTPVAKLQQLTVQCLHLLCGSWMAMYVQHTHYFNSLTPDQNNRIFAINITTCCVVCSDACRRTRVQCFLGGVFTGSEWPKQLFVYCGCPCLCFAFWLDLLSSFSSQLSANYDGSESHISSHRHNN